MDSPIIQYKKLMNIDNIKQIAYNTLFVKYIEQNKKGPEKLWEIDSTDQESLMIAKNGGFPLPGSIYTYLYPKKEGKVEIITQGKMESYIDLVPIVFCLGLKDDMILGINMNLLPPLERLNFLETYYVFYKKFFSDLEKRTENDILALNQRFISVASSKLGQKLLKLFVAKMSPKIKFAYRQYDMKNIVNIRMVEYAEWLYLPFYEPRSAFKGMNFKQLHDLYWKAK